MRKTAATMIGAALISAWPARAQAISDNSCPIHQPLSQTELTNKVARSIFQVIVTGADGVPHPNGTATLIDARGYMLTAGHVVDGYGDGSTGTIALRRFDGSRQARVVANFIADGLDVAVLLAPDVPAGTDPIPLRIDSPDGPGAPGSGNVLAYDNNSAAIQNPVSFHVGGLAGGTSTMTLQFAAIGGNSGALLLEPSGRAFGLLRDGPDPGAMQIPLYVPATLIPGRGGKFALPDIPITMLPEDLQAAVAAAGNSKALTISSFWDRLAKVIPASPAVANVLSDLRSNGWRSVVTTLDSQSGYRLSSTDLIHLFEAVGADVQLRARTIKEFGDAMNVIAETCSGSAFGDLVLMRALGPAAAIAAVTTEKSDNASLVRGATSRALADAIAAAAISSAQVADGRPLKELISDLAVVEANRAKLGEVAPDRPEQLVAIAEGLGGTATSGELAALYAARAGDPRNAAAFLALADMRLRDSALRDSKSVEERRQTIARIYNKLDGKKTLGTSVSRVSIEDVEAQLSGTDNAAPIVDSIVTLTPLTAEHLAQGIARPRF